MHRIQMLILGLAFFLLQYAGALSAQTGTDTLTTSQGPTLDSTQTLSEKLTQLFTQLDQDKNNASLHFDIAQEYFSLGRKAYALDYFEKSLKLDPSNMEAHYLRGEIFLSMGKRKSAYQEFLTVMRDYKADSYLDKIGGRFVSPYTITQITKNNYNDVMPSFSPDGAKILFQSDRNGNWDIFMMDAAAGEGSAVRLTTDPGSDENPCFSTDGKTIAFASTREDKAIKTIKSREIFIMDRAGKNVKKVTTSYGSDNWSPYFLDTTTILFASDRSDFSPHPFWEKTSSIYMIEKTGNFMFKFLGAEGKTYTDPVFAGDKIVFAEKVSGDNFEIASIPTEGKGNPTYLTNNPAVDIMPHVSPGGEFITFASNRDGNFEIYKMMADGSEPLRITYDDADDVFPRFSPDGTKIIFSSNRTGNYQIFMASLGQTSTVTVNQVITALEKKLSTATDY